MNKLPVEIICQLYGYLSLHDLLQTRSINKKYYKASCSQQLWKKLYIYKYDYLQDTCLYNRALIRGKHQLYIKSCWEHMSNNFHVLPYFYFIQETFGCHVIEYCDSKRAQLTIFEGLTLKYYITKTKRTVIRLSILDHFLKKDYTNICLSVLLIGFTSDPELHIKQSIHYFKILDELSYSIGKAIGTCTELSMKIKILMTLFFKSYKIDLMNSETTSCLHRCIEEQVGSPTFIAIILQYIGIQLGMEFEIMSNSTNLIFLSIEDKFINIIEFSEDNPYTRPNGDVYLLDNKAIVELSLNNLMVWISHSPNRSLGWFSSIYMCSWMCYFCDNINIGIQFIFQMFESTFCEDFLFLWKLMGDSTPFLEAYHQEMTKSYSEDNRDRELERYTTLYNTFSKIPPSADFNVNAPCYHFSTTRTVNGISQLAERVMKRDLMPRSQQFPKNCKYDIGQVVYHIKLHYYAVIHEMDETCQESSDWQDIMAVDSLIYKSNQPFYKVIVANDNSSKYVAQENCILASSEYDLQNTFITQLKGNNDFLFFCGQFFTQFDPDSCQFIPNNKTTLKYT